MIITMQDYFDNLIEERLIREPAYWRLTLIKTNNIALKILNAYLP